MQTPCPPARQPHQFSHRFLHLVRRSRPSPPPPGPERPAHAVLRCLPCRARRSWFAGFIQLQLAARRSIMSACCRALNHQAVHTPSCAPQHRGRQRVRQNNPRNHGTPKPAAALPHLRRVKAHHRVLPLWRPTTPAGIRLLPPGCRSRPRMQRDSGSHKHVSPPTYSIAPYPPGRFRSQLAPPRPRSAG